MHDVAMAYQVVNTLERRELLCCAYVEVTLRQFCRLTRVKFMTEDNSSSYCQLWTVGRKITTMGNRVIDLHF